MTDYDEAVQRTARVLAKCSPNYHLLAIHSLAKAYEILTMLDHVDSGDWLGDSVFAADLDRLARELGYESAMDVAITVNNDKRHDDRKLGEW